MTLDSPRIVCGVKIDFTVLEANLLFSCAFRNVTWCHRHIPPTSHAPPPHGSHTSQFAQLVISPYLHTNAFVESSYTTTVSLQLRCDVSWREWLLKCVWIWNMEVHEEAMMRLCFVCSEIIKGEIYEVDKYIALLGRALKCPEIFAIPGVTPYNFCKRCHAALSHVDRGKTVVTKCCLVEWTECGPNCSSCAYLTKRRVGGRKKKVSISKCFFLSFSFVCLIRHCNGGRACPFMQTFLIKKKCTPTNNEIISPGPIPVRI